MTWRMPRFLARHPRALLTIPPGLPALKPIASYATCTYYAIHAFRFVDDQRGSRYVRYRFAPEAGDEVVDPLAPDDELLARVLEATLAFLFGQVPLDEVLHRDARVVHAW